MAKPRLAILRTGSAPERVQIRHGDYVDMFRERLADERIDVEIFDAVDGVLPEVGRVDLAVITGSPASVTEVEPWVDRLASWSNDAIREGVPLLGVCYGHQVIAYGRGGAVEVNARGYEIGSVAVTLTKEGTEDPLLGSLDPEQSVLWFNAVHGDTVTRLPTDATLLAGNDVSPIQAYRVEDRTWCVQFHPEFSQDAVRMYVDERASTIRSRAEALGRDPEAALRDAAASVRDTPAGPMLLRRFVDLGLEKIG